jgi:hypothetical protein
VNEWSFSGGYAGKYVDSLVVLTLARNRSHLFKKRTSVEFVSHLELTVASYRISVSCHRFYGHPSAWPVYTLCTRRTVSESSYICRSNSDSAATKRQT